MLSQYHYFFGFFVPIPPSILEEPHALDALYTTIRDRSIH